MSALIANEVTPHPKHISELLVKINAEFSLPHTLALSFSLYEQLAVEE